MWLFLKNKKIRTRAAPSPTGDPHLGNLRTALYDYLYAKANKGSFIVRIEDTDQKRVVEQATENFLRALEWLGLSWDEGPDLRNNIIVGEKGTMGSYWQSRRLVIYKKYADELLAKGGAYYCFCTPNVLDEMRKHQLVNKEISKYDRRCRRLSQEDITQKRMQKLPVVVRLKVLGDKKVTFTDTLRGNISIDSDEVEDQVLIKSDGYPTYHLASVVDDHLMKITHVIRGEEWIASTPKHILLYSYFGWKPPVYTHLSLVLGTNKQKLSKREGSFSVHALEDEGYLPEAVINYLVFLGWRRKGDDRELYTKEELIKIFSLEDLNKSPAIFDHKKLDWFNQEYIKRLSIDTLVQKVQTHLNSSDKNFIKRLCQVEQPRFTRLTDAKESSQMYLEDIDYDWNKLCWKGMKREVAKKYLKRVYEVLKELQEKSWTIVEIERLIKAFISEEQLSNGEVLWPMRVALTGRERSPGPFESAYILQKEKSLQRLEVAIKKLEQHL